MCDCSTVITEKLQMKEKKKIRADYLFEMIVVYITTIT